MADCFLTGFTAAALAIFLGGDFLLAAAAFLDGAADFLFFAGAAFLAFGDAVILPGRLGFLSATFFAFVVRTF
ncbi:MAG TPA: hypothetical protein VJZ91_17075 [Blastocatellia bacterium]|nr:hypothetical protein [Blastocatellia bacterium]